GEVGSVDDGRDQLARSRAACGWHQGEGAGRGAIRDQAFGFAGPEPDGLVGSSRGSPQETGRAFRPAYFRASAPDAAQMSPRLLLLPVVLLLLGAAEKPAPIPELSPAEAAKQGREFTAELLRQKPTQNGTNSGTLKIRAGRK